MQKYPLPTRPSKEDQQLTRTLVYNNLRATSDQDEWLIKAILQLLKLRTKGA